MHSSWTTSNSYFPLGNLEVSFFSFGPENLTIEVRVLVFIYSSKTFSKILNHLKIKLHAYLCILNYLNFI